MYSKMFLLFFYLILSASNAQSHAHDFTYNGFLGSNVSLGGSATIISNGLLRLTNFSHRQSSDALYSFPLRFKDSKNGTLASFSTTFVIAIVPNDLTMIGNGMSFIISPSKNLSLRDSSQLLNENNSTQSPNSSHHIFAIEFDTLNSAVVDDVDDNNVEISDNSIVSIQSLPAAYYSERDGKFKNMTLASGKPIQVWVDYSGHQKHFQVSIAPLSATKPVRPLLSTDFDLSPILSNSTYIGFTAATGPLVSAHYVLGWSFKMNGRAQALDLSRLPKLPRVGPKPRSKLLMIGVPIIVVFFVLTAFSSVGFIILRRIKYAEVIEDWEKEYGPHRFSYKDLFEATKGFREKELLGEGGFGKVYKGVLPRSKIQVAIKRVSHTSKQGVKEFVAEIVSLGRLRHRNLVQLLGYCRRKGELLLVYEFMPNGSLDKFLFDEPQITLTWHQRYRIIRGVASGLLYLHEEWEQVVLHRDVKASNVLLDNEFNGRLGDFGLARLYDHGSNPRTTRVVGTFGYIAAEMTRTGKATMSTDVFAFGVFMLEVACGRAPIGEVLLVDWVWECWRSGEILEARDVKLGDDYAREEVELVLKLGLLCVHPIDTSRPTMRQVVQYLEGDFGLLDILSKRWTDLRERADGRVVLWNEMGLLSPFTSDKSSLLYSSSTMYEDSILSGGR